MFEVRGPFGGWFVWDPPSRRAAVPGRGRLGAGPADVDAAPPPQRRQRGRRGCWSRAREPDDVLYARGAREAGARRHLHLHAPGAARAGRLHPPRRLARCWPRSRSPAARTYVCGPDRLRRVGRQRPRRARPRPGEHQNGALRRRATMEHLDGNAAAGDLSEVFALDVDDGGRDLRRLRRDRAGREAMVYEAGMGTVLRCPECDIGAAAARARARREHAGDARRQAAAAGKAPADHPRAFCPGSSPPTSGWRARSAAASGARSAADSIAAQRRLDEAVEVGADRDVVGRRSRRCGGRARPATGPASSCPCAAGRR